MPLTAKGQEIERNMTKEYGAKKGEEVFYASRNAGKITGVDAEARWDDATMKYASFLTKCQEGDWEAMGDVNSFGRVEVRDTDTGRRFTVSIEERLEVRNDAGPDPFVLADKLASDVRLLNANVAKLETRMRMDSTDRREVESLSTKLRDAGKQVSFNMDDDGYILSIAVAGKIMSPLSFAEWARKELAK